MGFRSPLGGAADSSPLDFVALSVEANRDGVSLLALIREALFEGMDMSGSRVELPPGESELLFDQLELPLELLHLAIVVCDPPFEIVVGDFDHLLK